MIIERTQPNEATTLLGVQGRIGEAVAKELEQALLQVFDSGCYQLVLDLAEVDFMTSSGLGVLMMGMKRTRRNRGFVRIACPQPLIEQILRTTRLDTFFEIFPTADEALQAQAQEPSSDS